MFDKLERLVSRHAELTDILAHGNLKPSELLPINKERSGLESIVETYLHLKNLLKEKEDNHSLLNDSDPQMREMAKEELHRLTSEIEGLEAHLKVLLLPKDPNDQRNVIFEVRAGTGGDEASLFAGELFQMYARFAEMMRWKVEILSSSEGGRGGFKEVVAEIKGDQVYSWLKFEPGVHRVQRVPDTETQGRVHTSACTVAVLADIEDDIEIEIRPEDLRVDTYRAGGAGGQHVNKTESAVRITHLPTGVVVQCQDERSQVKNKAKCMKVLKAKLYEANMEAQEQAQAAERKSMVKSGDRSDKIRTYNFPQDRCTDHRIGLTVHNLPKLFAGDMKDFLTQVRAHFQAEALKGAQV